MRRTIVVFAGLLLVAGGCASKPTPSASQTPSATAGASASASTSATPSAAPVATGSTEPSETCKEARSWGTSPETLETHATAELYNVRSGQHQCYDRVVFDINGPAQAGYRVQYVAQVLSEGKGDPVPVTGGAALQVVVLAPSLMEAGHQPARQPWQVGDRVVQATPQWQSLREVKFAGSFEGQCTFAVGTRAKLPFHVSLWQDGAVMHVVVDIAH